MSSLTWRLYLLLFGLVPGIVAAQTKTATLRVTVTNEGAEGIPNASVQVEGGTVWRTDAEGTVEKILTLPEGEIQQQVIVTITATAFDTLRKQVLLRSGKTKRLTVNLLPISTDTVEVSGREGTTGIATDRDAMMSAFDVSPEAIAQMAGATTDLEQVMRLQAGGTGSEFSSQYRIRGGSYDENLVYVNGVEIYRPQLVRAGTQEGLPLTNSRMAQDIRYGAGGFQARFGDKLSSVLDVDYREPRKFATQLELGLLNQYITTEGYISPGQKRQETAQRTGTATPSTLNGSNAARRPGSFSYLVGARRFSLGYLFNTLDTEGAYEPTSFDVQTVLTYTPPVRNTAPKLKARKDGTTDTLERPIVPLKISFLGILSSNRYRFEPETRETTFGTLSTPFRLLVGFNGEEQLQYLVNQGAVIVDHRPNLRWELKYILSSFRSDEDERFDVEGGYRLGDVSPNLGGDDFGDITFIRGIGTEIRYGRNFLTLYNVYGAARARVVLDRNFYRYTTDDYVRHRLYFGARVQQEWAFDRLDEWTALDSAEFVTGDELIRSRNTLTSQRFQGYVQYGWKPSAQTILHVGTRVNHWTLNGETVISPRAQFQWELPLARRDTTRATHLNRKLQLQAAVGMYQQPPYFRELRRFDGSLNTDVQAQQSLHAVLGATYLFTILGNPFRLSSEIYYKRFWNLVPFEYENVRVRYYPDETAKGYAYGLDAKLNGQFIKGVDSWFRLSLLNTKEDVAGDSAGFVARPTDQRVVFTMFFQDHVPRLKRLKVNLTLVYGTGLPFGPPRTLENRTVFRAPHYQRVDIGLSYLVTFRGQAKKKFGLKSLWLGFEVYNLLQRANTISYQWVNDLFGVRYAVPNFLSQRFINGRVQVQF